MVSTVYDAAKGSTEIDLVIQPSSLAAINVQPSPAIIRKNETLNLLATAYDIHGNVIPDVAFLWTADQLTIDGTGKVIAGNQEGLYEVMVQARLKGVEQTALVNVGVPPVFIPLEEMSRRRGVHTATLLQDGRVLIVGGGRSAELYDPATHSFSSTGDTIRSRTGHSATLLPNGKVLIASGSCTDPNAELYDPLTGTFEFSDGNLEQGRRRHTGTLLDDGTVLIAGGYCAPWPDKIVGLAEIYDPIADAFTLTRGDMVSPRAFHAATLLPTGEVLLARGQGSGQPGCVFTMELFDPTTSTFRETGKNIYQGGCSDDRETLELLPDDRVLITHGALRMELYDPTTDTFTTGYQWDARYSHTTTTLESGLVLIAGGHPGEFGMYDTAVLYDPITDTMLSEIPMISPRLESSATLLASGEVLLAGGSMNNVRNDERTRSDLALAELFIP